MKILNGHSLAGNGWIRPDSMGLNLEERNSTATVSMALDGAEGLAVGQWLQDDREPGDGIVWRIRTMDRQYDRNTVTITLEHAIQTLKDRILFGDVTAAMMSGTAGASTCTARQAVAYILAQQGDWVLGDFGFDGVSNPYKFNGETLMDALETVSNSLTDPLWEYDFSAYPFVLHIRQMGSGVGSEMRMSRNISSLRLTIDRSGMYTRFYPIGKNNLKLAGGYVSRNEAVWGIVSKVETDQSKTSAAELTAWANERLNRHAEPLITGTISGMDYSERTGESLDRLAIGQKCRVPLPEYGTTITERITKLSWRDKIGQKEAVTVTLANKRQDVATILKEQAASGGRGGRAGAKNAEEDHAWFVDTTDKVAMVAEAVAGKDGSGDPNWSRVAQLTVDGSGIDARVTYAEGEIVTHATRITQTENAITAEVTRATGAEGTLSSRITQTADAITAEVTRATGAESGLSGRIDVEAGRIGLVVEGSGSGATVKRASIIAAVTDNNGQLDSSITMAADNVIIGSGSSAKSVTVVVNGKLTTTDLSSSIANLGLVEVQRLSTTNDIAAGSLYGQNIYISGATAQADPFSVKNFLKNVRVTTATSGYKLQYQTYSGGDTWTDAGNFSSAVTLSGAWSSGRYTVSATSGTITGTAPSTALIKGTETWENGVASVPIMYYDTDSTRPEGNAYTASVNAPAATVSAGTWTNGAVTVTAKHGTATLGSATVNAPTVTVSAGTWSNGSVTVNATHGTKNLGTTVVNAPSATVSAGTWANGAVTVTAKHGTATLGSTTVNAPTVTVSAGSWSNGSITVNATHGTKNLGTTVVNAPSATVSAGSWSNGSVTVTAKHGTATLGSTTVSAPSASLSFDCTDLGSSTEGNSKPITATAKHGTATLGTGSQVIYMGTGSWSSGKIGVTCRLTDSNGKCVCRVYVSKPSVSITRAVKTGNTYTVYGKVGGSSEIQLGTHSA